MSIISKILLKKPCHAHGLLLRLSAQHNQTAAVSLVQLPGASKLNDLCHGHGCCHVSLCFDANHLANRWLVQILQTVQKEVVTWLFKAKGKKEFSLGHSVSKERLMPTYFGPKCGSITKIGPWHLGFFNSISGELRENQGARTWPNGAVWLGPLQTCFTPALEAWKLHRKKG